MTSWNNQVDISQPYHDPNDEPGAEPLKPDFFDFENRQPPFDREMLKRELISEIFLNETANTTWEGLIYAEIQKPILDPEDVQVC